MRGFYLLASLHLFPFLASKHGISELLVVLLAILASLKVNIRFNFAILQSVMGFHKITIAHEIRINSFRVCLDITLFSDHVIKLAPTHELVSIANGSKCHGHNIDNLNILIKEVNTIISIHVIVQDTVIKLCIVGAHNQLCIVTRGTCIKLASNIHKRRNLKRVKCHTIHVKLCLILHKAIATNKNLRKWGFRNLTHEEIMRFKSITLAILENPRNIKSKASIGQSLNVKNSENLTHDRTSNGSRGRSLSPPDNCYITLACYWSQARILKCAEIVKRKNLRHFYYITCGYWNAIASQNLHTGCRHKKLDEVNFCEIFKKLV